MYQLSMKLPNSTEYNLLKKAVLFLPCFIIIINKLAFNLMSDLILKEKLLTFGSSLRVLMTF